MYINDHDEYNKYEHARTRGNARPTIEEVEDEGDIPLPSLPWSSPAILIPELGFTHNAERTPTEENAGTRGISSPSKIDQDHSLPSWVPTIQFGLLCAPRDQFIENSGHPLATAMPGLFSWDPVSSHSSIKQVSDMGDNDPHGLCAEAIQEAVRTLHLQSSRILYNDSGSGGEGIAPPN
ncbi:hypothetical protein K438DRAFT_1976792 [Mycena galopus ATCC 62051]|nr:hypothetical protein K438DRAFT_1976792 [Mycena galopus ATCC 62051]